VERAACVVVTPSARACSAGPRAGRRDRRRSRATKRPAPIDLPRVRAGDRDAALQGDVLGVEAGRLHQHVQRLSRPAGALERVGGVHPETRRFGRGEVAGGGTRGRHLGVGGGSRKTAEAHQALGDASLVALLAAALQKPVQVEGRIGVERLLDGNLRQLRQRVVARRIDLQGLLVEGDGLGDETGIAMTVADLDEPRDGLRAVADLDIEIAERVGGPDVAGLVFDEAQILCDRELGPALAHQVLCLLDGRSAIYGHARFIPSYQTASRA
jgi:hypothetical protein